MSIPQQTLAIPLAIAPPSSFEEAYRDYAQCAARWARHLGGIDIDVEDVVQEVFWVVSKRFAAFRAEARFSSWLFQITRRVVANHRRRQRWRFWRGGGEQALSRLPSERCDPGAELERRQVVVRFYAALDGLPEKYRTVLVLYEIEGLNLHTIADLCQRNPGTVKVHLGRARQAFVKQYKRLLKKEEA
jgi:RNA polymerase sigma-70 factor, ECF subfamily